MDYSGKVAAGTQTLRRVTLLTRAASLAIAISATSGMAHAQSETPATEAAEANEILVTGSRIRGIEPTGSNVVSVGSEEIKNTSSVTVGDLLRQVPQIAGTGINEGTYSGTSGVNATRASAINLRGVGPIATLPLIDGHRLVAQGTSGRFLDPSVVPVSAVERVEVVADGASAIYGADAIAGVYNVVLRRSLDGVEAGGTYGFADGTDEWSTHVALGKKWASGQIMLVYEHSDRSRLAGTSRPYFTSDNRGNGGTDYRANQCDRGTLIVNGVNYPIPQGTVTSANLVAGPANRCDLQPYNDILPAQNRDVLAGTVTQELTDWLEFSGFGLYVDRKFSVFFTSQGPTNQQQNIVIGAANPYLVLPAGVVPAGPITVAYSFAPQYGAIEATGYERTHQLVGGFNVSLPAGWKAWLGGVYGHNEAVQINAHINTPALTTARTSADPAIAFNPFGTNSASVLNSIFSSTYSPVGKNKLRVLEFRADGPLFELPAGKVRAAIGYENGRIDYTGASLMGGAGVYVPVKRTTQSVFGEVYVPLLDSENMGNLALSAAVRHDDYSDFGSTTNPKFGLTYKPMRGLSFNASYGTSFRAPDLDSILTRKPISNISYTTRLDPLVGTQVPVVVLIAGNPNLRPETATTWSFGTTFEPQSVPGLKLNVNYFNLDYRDQISSIFNEPAVLQRRTEFAGLIRQLTPAQTQAQILADPVVAGLIAAGVPQLPNTFATLNYIIDGRPYNVGRTKTDGLDFDLSYLAQLGGGSLLTRLVGAYTFNFDVQQSPTGPIVAQVNNYPYSTRLKMRGSLLWKADRYSVGGYANFVNAYNNPLSATARDVDAFLTFDLHASIGIPFAGSQTELSFDVKNVFDRDPPFVDVVGAYDPAQASAMGRLVTLSLRTKF